MHEVENWKEKKSSLLGKKPATLIRWKSICEFFTMRNEFNFNLMMHFFLSHRKVKNVQKRKIYVLLFKLMRIDSDDDDVGFAF